MEEEEPQDFTYQDHKNYTIFKWSAGIVGFLAIMGLFIWVTVPPPPPELAPMVRVSSLPHDKQLSRGSANRLILVGDVHGMHKEFKKLLKQAEFNPKHDQLVLLGDFISKGPNSLAVLDDAIRYNAACVRGNHEDDLLALYAQLRGIEAPLTYPPNALDAPATFGMPVRATIWPTKGSEWQSPEPTGAATADRAEKEDGSGFSAAKIDETRDKALTLHLEPRHIRYLEECPGILKLGQVKNNGGHGVAVHGGLLWDEPDLEKQRPEIIFRLRSLLPPNYTIPSDDSGAPWARFFNAEQKKLEPARDRTTVFYGHDASRGLHLRKYTKGLDSRCVRGGELTAMVLSMTNHGKVKSSIVSVDCNEHYESMAEKGPANEQDQQQLADEFDELEHHI